MNGVQGGYEDWLKHQETCEFVQRFAEEGRDLKTACRGSEFSDSLAARAAVKLAQVAMEMLAEAPNAEERWRRLLEILPQLAELRRHDHRAARLRHDQEIWEREDAQREAALEKAEANSWKREALAPLWAKLQSLHLAPVFGGGEAGRFAADLIIAVGRDLPLPKKEDYAIFDDSESIAANGACFSPSQSNPVKPGQTKKPETDSLITYDL